MIVDNYTVKWQYEGGLTTCLITDTKTEKVTIGTALLGNKEQLNKDTGRKISLQRAIAKAFPYKLFNVMERNDETKTLRSKFWETYRTMTNKPRWQIK